MAEDIRSSLERIIADAAPIDLAACYEGTVVQQRADGTFDVKVDDERFGEGLVGIPYDLGLPGVSCTCPKGARVVVGFHNSRELPYVRHFLSGMPLTLKFEANSKVTVESAGDVDVSAVGNVNAKTTTGDVTVEASLGSATVKAGVSVTVDAPVIKHGPAAVLGVARQGDAVQAGPYAGNIIGPCSAKTLSE